MFQLQGEITEERKNISIYAVACVLGDITIGNNVFISTKVVIDDIPDNVVVVDIPDRIIKINN